MSTETIAFNPEQQAAVLGHSLDHPSLWERLEGLSCGKEWFIDPVVGKGYHYLQEYRKAHKNRPPTSAELKAFVVNTDPKLRKEIEAILDQATKAAKLHNLDTLIDKIHHWAKARVMKEKGRKLNDVYNGGDHEEAAKLWHDGAAELNRLDFTAGMADDFETSSARISDEEKERYAETNKVLPYGISFLDDALGGIFPKDLIMIGARSGAGKTDLAKAIARYNAERGKEIYCFFLEAENKEIERRIKYQMLADRYYASFGDERPPGIKRISYKLWRLGKLKEELDVPFGKDADEEIREKLKTMHTFYRAKNTFGIREMEREILKVQEKADLIILDHLHYVDLEGDDENREMTRLVSKLNDISLARSKPIIVVAHINKAGGNTLVPGMNDFHGSSNITKMARTGIMLAPCNNSVISLDPKSRGYGTYMRVVKCRLDGSVLANTAVSFFSTENNTYAENYAIGHLNFPGTKWSLDNERPYWAERGTVTEVSDGE
jgi:replicative DNA helicase